MGRRAYVAVILVLVAALVHALDEEAIQELAGFRAVAGRVLVEHDGNSVVDRVVHLDVLELGLALVAEPGRGERRLERHLQPK